VDPCGSGTETLFSKHVAIYSRLKNLQINENLAVGFKTIEIAQSPGRKYPGVPTPEFTTPRGVPDPGIFIDCLKLWPQGKTPDPEVNGKQKKLKVCKK
jgi:hypothetical protein